MTRLKQDLGMTEYAGDLVTIELTEVTVKMRYLET